MAKIVSNSLKNFLKAQVSTQQVRFLPRWTHRRPVRVYSSEEYEQSEQAKNEPDFLPKPTRNVDKSLFNSLSETKINWKHPSSSIKSEGVQYKVKVQKPLSANTQKTKKISTTDMLETVIDQEGNYIYTKLSDNDPRVGLILTEVKSKKEKESKDLMLLEGKRLIKDALTSNCTLKYIIFSRKSDVDFIKPFLPKTGAKLYKMPYNEMQMWSDLTTTPGIMGIFKVPNLEDYVSKDSLPFTVICDNIREPGNLGTILRICAGVGTTEVLLSKGCANLWESKVLRSAMGAHFKLRLSKNCSWEQIKETIGNKNVFIADNRLVSDVGDNDELSKTIGDLPLLPYYGVDFKKYKEVVLIIGGETHGISAMSYDIASDLKGVRLNIPLSNGVDSLNVGGALGVIAFEIKRQLSQK